MEQPLFLICNVSMAGSVNKTPLINSDTGKLTIATRRDHLTIYFSLLADSGDIRLDEWLRLYTHNDCRRIFAGSGRRRGRHRSDSSVILPHERFGDREFGFVRCEGIRLSL